MPAPDLSIIIPVYNSAKWLADCLDSLLRHNEVNSEILCIDDGSTDDSPSVLAQYLGRYPKRIKVLTQSNQGQSAARNAGIDIAQGQYLWFFDSDDRCTPNRLDRILQQADDAGLDVRLFAGKSFRDSSASIRQWLNYLIYYKRGLQNPQILSGMEIAALLAARGMWRPSPVMYFINRRYLAEVGTRFIPGIIHEDDAFTFDVVLKAKRTFQGPEQLYLRRIRANSTMTGKDKAYSAYSYTQAFGAMLDTCQSLNPPDEATARYVAEIVARIGNAAAKLAAPGYQDINDRLASAPDSPIKSLVRNRLTSPDSFADTPTYRFARTFIHDAAHFSLAWWRGDNSE